jgi:hypothetical protein
MSAKIPATERGLTSRIGRVKIDWPRTTGYYGGIGIAVACGLIDPPLGLFIAAIPFLKMLNRPDASRASRLTGQLLDGAAQPVGGDGKGTITLVAPTEMLARRPGSIWAEARRIADRKEVPTRD